ncbi:MAG: DUF423 domain-containing protein [Chitinivibrionales bacterium]|nr:DUF423 domain-containing protein [Chitinivibrionales bacterium]
MTPFTRLFVVLGGLNAALSVVLGAFGAHALKTKLTGELMSTYQTGVQYHFFHSIGLLVMAFAASHLDDFTLVRIAGWTMLTGIALFSGSLYILSLTGIKWLGAITPFGGMAFIFAWLMLAGTVIRK